MPRIYSNINSLSAEQKAEVIRKNFDFMISESYYAGSDEYNDSVFLGRRKGDKLFLVNRPPKSLSIFTTVFRGMIITDGDKCYIKGYFGKRLFDYFLYVLLSALVMLFAVSMQSFSDSGGILLAIIWGCVTLLFMFPLKGTRIRYIDFLTRVANFIE